MDSATVFFHGFAANFQLLDTVAALQALIPHLAAMWLL